MQPFSRLTSMRPEDCCLHDVFTQTADRFAESDAVLFEGRRLTYQELNEQANRIAAALAALGVGPEKLVAVAVPRSLELVPVLLGILKAGAAYLPLDTESPPERWSLPPAMLTPVTYLARRTAVASTRTPSVKPAAGIRLTPRMSRTHGAQRGR